MTVTTRSACHASFDLIGPINQNIMASNKRNNWWGIDCGKNNVNLWVAWSWRWVWCEALRGVKLALSSVWSSEWSEAGAEFNVKLWVAWNWRWVRCEAQRRVKLTQSLMWSYQYRWLQLHLLQLTMGRLGNQSPHHYILLDYVWYQ